MSIVCKYNLTQFDSVVTKNAEKPNMAADNNPYTEPTQNVKFGTIGNDARWVQWYLWRFGLLDKSSIDGIVGSKLVSSIKIAQTRLGLASDGIVGKNTRKAFFVALLNKFV